MPSATAAYLSVLPWLVAAACLAAALYWWREARRGRLEPTGDARTDERSGERSGDAPTGAGTVMMHRQPLAPRDAPHSRPDLPDRGNPLAAARAAAAGPTQWLAAAAGPAQRLAAAAGPAQRLAAAAAVAPTATATTTTTAATATTPKS